MIRPVHLVLLIVFLTFIFYIDIIVIIVNTTVNATTATIGISEDRFVVDLRKRELYFVICKGLEGLKDYNIIRCLASVY